MWVRGSNAARALAVRQDAMERERGAGSRGVPRLWAKREERAGEKSDQPHAVAAVGAGLVGLDGDWFVGFAAVDCDHRWVGCGCCEQLTAEGEFGAAVAIGEIAVMTDAVEPVGQDMEEEAADELFGGKRHHLLSAAVAVVCPAEAHAAVFEREQPAVRDRHAVGVAGEVSQHLPGAGERALA